MSIWSESLSSSYFSLQYDFLVRVEDTYPIFIALVGLSSALICYYIVLHAVKAKLIVLCYALPLHLLTPLTLLVIYVVKVTEVNGNMLSDLYVSCLTLLSQ